MRCCRPHDRIAVASGTLHHTLTFEQRLEESRVHEDTSGGSLPLDEVGFAACVLDRRLRYRRANAAWRAHLRGETFRFGRQSGTWRNREILADIPHERRERWSSALAAI